MSRSAQPPADIVIVGAGVIGLSIAWVLRDSGARVRVVERAQPGQGASWAGGGILWPLPPDRIDPLIEPLLRRSLERYPLLCAEIAERSGIDPEYIACGARHIVGDRMQDFPQIAQVRNPRLLQSLLAAVRASGVEVLTETPVRGWRTAGGRLRGVETAHGVLECAQAVLAAGAWSASLAALPVRPIKGEMLLLRAAPGALDRILIGEDAYIVPRRDGHLLVGSTLDDVGFDLTPTPAARERLMYAATQLWPEIAALPLERQWAGLRPHAEAAPIISALPEAEGLYACTGHFRIGLTLAPASAELVADLLLGRSPQIDVAPFRFPRAAAHAQA